MMKYQQAGRSGTIYSFDVFPIAENGFSEDGAVYCLLKEVKGIGIVGNYFEHIYFGKTKDINSTVLSWQNKVAYVTHIGILIELDRTARESIELDILQSFLPPFNSEVG